MTTLKMNILTIAGAALNEAFEVTHELQEEWLGECPSLEKAYNNLVEVYQEIQMHCLSREAIQEIYMCPSISCHLTEQQSTAVRSFLKSGEKQAYIENEQS